MKYTRQGYVDYLNEFPPAYESELWIIGGKLRKTYRNKEQYGQAIRKHDPIAFEVGFQEWQKTF